MRFCAALPLDGNVKRGFEFVILGFQRLGIAYSFDELEGDSARIFVLAEHGFVKAVVVL